MVNEQSRYASQLFKIEFGNKADADAFKFNYS